MYFTESCTKHPSLYGCIILVCITCVHSSFAIILKRNRKRVTLQLLSYILCIFTINALWLFLRVPLAGLQCVLVVFPDQTHLLSFREAYSQLLFSREGRPVLLSASLS